VLHRDHRNARGRQPREVAEQRAAVHEGLHAVAHQVGAGAFHQVQEGQLLLQRDLLHAQDLLQAHGLDRARLDARIAGHHHAAHAAHEADAGDHAAARHRGVRVPAVLQVAGQRAQGQPGRARVQQQAHPLARQQLAAPLEHRTRLGRFVGRPLLQRAQVADAREHGFAALLRDGRLRVPAHRNTFGVS
jgi:hypothetical protein